MDLTGVKIGDELICLRNRQRDAVIVTKVGRLLLTLKYKESGHELRDKYRIENGVINDEYGHSSVTTPEAYQWAMENSRLRSRLFALGVTFNYQLSEDTSNAKLQAIIEILEAP